MSTISTPDPIPTSGLHVRRICVARAGNLVIDQQDLHLTPGSGMILRGPNGRGKSTLLRALSGLLPLTSGDVLIDGENMMVGDRVESGRHVVYLGHSLGLKPALTALEWLAAHIRMDGRQVVEDDMLDALELVGLGPRADDPIQGFSAGQRQRLALARIVVMDRPIWLLDEPTVGLDVASVALFSKLVAAHLQKGGMMLAATHIDFGFDADILDLGGRP